MKYEEIDYYKGHDKGKTEGKVQSLEVLSRVLDSMKSDPSTYTASIMNRILDEIYQKVSDELT